MSPSKKKALIEDLRRLKDDIPAYITAIITGDEKLTKEAVAVVQGAYRERTKFLMDHLTDYVLAEAKKGNREPLLGVASGRAFDQ